MAGNNASGVSSAIQLAVAEAGPMLPLSDPEQLELLRSEKGTLTRASIDAAVAKSGRPRGAINKRTAKVRDYLLSRYAHPLEVLAQAYSRPTDALAAELGCKREEAFALQIKAAAELAPYIEGKMPVSVNLAVQSDLHLVIPGFNHAGQTIDAVAAELRMEFEQNQEDADA